MSRRASAAANRIRGPQSALTDFLASHNISAQQISSDYQRRQREDEEQAAQQAIAAQGEDKENESDLGDEAPEERKKRKRKEEKAIMKIKQSKEFRRRKYEKKRRDSDEEDDDALARSMLSKSKPLAGQLENCEICEKRFTVTPYSKSGPDGGLLCTACSKELVDDTKNDLPKKKRGPPKLKKRQTESDRMMGNVKPGAKSLLDSCIVKVASVVHDIEEFGDLPQTLLDRLSQILSKNRVINSHTLDLFLRSDVDKIDIYDSGRLEEEDFQKIFAFMPNIKSVNLRFAGQLKDDVIMYMLEKNTKIRNLQLGATNLVSDNAWRELFQRQGPLLESLKLSELNDSFNDGIVEEMAAQCTKIRRLKLRQCLHMGEASLISIGKMTSLEHLSLAVSQEASSAAIVNLIERLGPDLRTLSLEQFIDAEDDVLAAIHSSCVKLGKLRFTGNANCSDQAFADVFTNWSNPPLRYIDLSSNRDLDNARPEGSQDAPLGFGSEGCKALMKHSGPLLERLNLSSCRHISHNALSEVFDGRKQYPCLRDMDLSLIPPVDEAVMTGIFRSCPQLMKLAAFGCFNARGAMVPPGIAVIGLPNAQESIFVNGDAVVDL